MAKKKQTQQIQQLSPENYILQKARNLPVFECMVNEDWEFGKMASVSVARKHTNGNITLGLYLVDLNCLGVKDAHYLFNVSEPEYRRTITSNGNLDLISISYELAHNIVYAGLEFAKELGFNPHKDFSVARYILEEDTDEVELIEIECGKNGKPLYVKSELESNRIIAQLEREVGKGNYDFITPVEYEEIEEKNLYLNEEEDEFSKLTFEEKQVLFHQLLDSMKNMDKVDHKKLKNLIASGFNDLVDTDLVDDYNIAYVDNLDVEILPIEEIPFELWGVEPDNLVITDKITNLFIKAYNLSNDNTKKASKKVTELKKITGDIPAVRLLELILLQGYNKEEEAMNLIVDNISKFPDYHIFRLQYSIARINGGKIPEEYKDSIPTYSRIFGDRTSLYEIEYLNYLLLFIALIDQEENATKLEALLWVIEETELPEWINTVITNEIMALKFKFVLNYFSVKGKE